MESTADHPVWLLAWGTIGIAIIVAIVMLVRFYGKNKAHPMEGKRERNIEEIRDAAERR